MYAKLPTTYTSYAVQPVNKETINTFNVVANTDKGLKDVITVRLYMGRSSSASTVHACIWIKGKVEHYSGSGSAGGYGYCKSSKAVCNAISDAGITLYGDVYRSSNRTRKRCYIGGVGMTAVRDALKAIARAAGYRGELLIVEN